MSTIVYEYPTNQQTRKFLRLEQAFKTVRDLLEIKQPPPQKAALFRMMEIIDFFERNDIRSELLKELERLQQTMQVLIDNPAVDSSKLNYFMNQLSKLSSSLNLEGRPCDVLKQDEFLTIVRQKWSLGATLCSFDSPQIKHFVSMGSDYTYEKLSEWMGKIKIYRTSVNVILKLYRESGAFTQCITQNLNYQQAIDNKIKMVAIKLPIEIPFVPEVSLGAHRLSMQLKPVINSSASEDIEIQFAIAHYRA
ncbi:MAG TPA: cell division protein ZapD [Aeromonadales bacterium]|nr:cell division protein ZapD [Aeromonadales bacterium]